MVMNDDEKPDFKLLGYLDANHFCEHRANASEGLIMFGGSFHKALGYTLFRADLNNAIKLMRVWAQECEMHAILYKAYLAKQKAESGQG